MATKDILSFNKLFQFLVFIWLVFSLEKKIKIIWIQRLFLSDVIYILPGKKNPKIVVQNNAYVINKKSEGRTSWRCAMYFKTKCSGRIVTRGKTLSVAAPHNHNATKPSLIGAIKQFVNIINE